MPDKAVAQAVVAETRRVLDRQNIQTRNPRRRPRRRPVHNLLHRHLVIAQKPPDPHLARSTASQTPHRKTPRTLPHKAIVQNPYDRSTRRSPKNAAAPTIPQPLLPILKPRQTQGIRTTPKAQTPHQYRSSARCVHAVALAGGVGGGPLGLARPCPAARPLAPTRPPPQAGEEKKCSRRSTAPSGPRRPPVVSLPACAGRSNASSRLRRPPRYPPSRLREGPSAWRGFAPPHGRWPPPGLPRKRGRRRIAAAAPPPPPARAGRRRLPSRLCRPLHRRFPPAQAAPLSPLPLAQAPAVSLPACAGRSIASSRLHRPLHRPPSRRPVISPPACGRGWGRAPRRGGVSQGRRAGFPSPVAGVRRSRPSA